MKILWFDTETTGLDPIKNDIIQIAGIIEIDGQVEETFEFKCAPINKQNIDDEALKIHGFTREEIGNWKHPFLIYEKLTELFSKYVDKYDKTDKFIPAGQNVQFDVNFLRQFFFKNNDNYFGSFCSYHTLDTLNTATLLDYLGLLPTLLNHKLETLAKYFNVEIKAHDALSDITATRKVFFKMLKGLENEKY